jgi:hypothetical protein
MCLWRLLVLLKIQELFLQKVDLAMDTGFRHSLLRDQLAGKMHLSFGDLPQRRP